MFEFDPAKSAANKAKHGIDFEEATGLWVDGKRVTIGPRRTNEEERYLVLAQLEERLWTAIITVRQDNIRLISVRRPRDDQRKLYRENNDFK